MSLSPGTRFGPYEVVGAIGAGGMGEVYRARDTSLHRDVAIKVLPDAFVHDAARLTRFQREAEALAALNHSNIAQIFGVVDVDGARAIAMELVEGETLAERIARGPIAIDETLAIAAQIADALEAAHERGIVHRDLKPANVKIRDDGVVKVLDFGLAKAVASESALSSGTTPPTMTSPATQLGVILGTAAYMSPEQARGRPVDRRTDLWAFGCVLYEMLTARRAFEGEDVTETLGRVLERAPDLSLLPPQTPPSIRRLLRRCFEKSPRDRTPGAASARLDIKDALAAPAEEARASAQTSPRRWWQRPVPVAVACLGLGAAAVLITPRVIGRTAERLVSRTVVLLPPGDSFDEELTGLSLSPDGRTLVYAAMREGVVRLFRRPIDTLTATPMPGTEGAQLPFFWPGSQIVGFSTRGPDRPSAVWKAPMPEGTPVMVVSVNAGTYARGGVIDDADNLVFGTHTAGLFRTSTTASGAVPKPVTVADGEAPHRFPDLLPGGGLLFSIGGTPAANEIAVLPPDGGAWRKLLNGTDARYAPTGHLVFWREDKLWAVRFDPVRLVATGEEVVVLDRVSVSNNGRAHYAWSSDGTLAYLQFTRPPARTLVWVDRRGKETPLPLEPGPYSQPELSPSGTRILLTRTQGGTEDVVIWDGNIDRLTPLVEGPPSDMGAMWGRTEESVVYSSRKAGPFDVYSTSRDSAAAPVMIVRGSSRPTDWTTDGRLIFESQGGLFTFSLEKKEAAPLLSPPGVHTAFAKVSPDGQSFAYHSTEVGGQMEVFVRSLSNPHATRVQVSNNGGRNPRWSPDGREIFYRRGDAVMAAPVSTSPAFRLVGPPTPLFTGLAYGLDFDVDNMGRRFLMIKNPPPSPAAPIVIVHNWFAELERLVPRR